MSAPGVIVLEKRTCWEAELKRAFSDSAILVRACRLPAQVSSLVAEMPASVLVLHLEIGTAESLRLLGKVVEMTPPISSVVIAPAQEAELEWAVRELGAADFLCEPLTGIRLAGLCRRLLEKNVWQQFDAPRESFLDGLMLRPD